MSVTYPDLSFTSFPDNLQNFPQMKDITAADAVNVNGYQQAIEAGNTQLAAQYLSQITEADKKIINASKLNTMYHTCIALQRFFDGDISSYLTQQEELWEDKINQFAYKGVFSAQAQYVKNNFVLYTSGGVDYLYICLSNPPVGTIPTNSQYWRQVSIRGERGESGSGTVFAGEWNASTTYNVDTMVSYQNSIWVCIAQNSGNPPTPTSMYWTLYYSSGQTIYPFQPSAPQSAVTGDLWFQEVL